MDKNDIILCLIIITLLYLIYQIDNLKNNKLKNNKLECFDITLEEQIKLAVKRIYLADVEAIRILSNFAIQLSQGGTIIPGKVTFTNDVTTTNIIATNLKIGDWIIRDKEGHLQFFKNSAKNGVGTDLSPNSLNTVLNPDKPFFSINGTDGNLWLNKNGRLGRGWLSNYMDINCDNINVKNINASNNIISNNLIANNSINIKEWILYQNDNKNLDFSSKIIDPDNIESQNRIKYSFTNQNKNISSCDIPEDIDNYKSYEGDNCMNNTWN